MVLWQAPESRKSHSSQQESTPIQNSAYTVSSGIPRLRVVRKEKVQCSDALTCTDLPQPGAGKRRLQFRYLGSCCPHKDLIAFLIENFSTCCLSLEQLPKDFVLFSNFSVNNCFHQGEELPTSISKFSMGLWQQNRHLLYTYITNLFYQTIYTVRKKICILYKKRIVLTRNSYILISNVNLK